MQYFNQSNFLNGLFHGSDARAELVLTGARWVKLVNSTFGFTAGPSRTYVFHMAPVTSSGCYQTAVQFLSVYPESVHTLLWPYISSSLFPHLTVLVLTSDDATRPRWLLSHSELHRLPFSSMPGCRDLSGQTPLMLLSVLNQIEPGWVSLGDSKPEACFIACKCS